MPNGTERKLNREEQNARNYSGRNNQEGFSALDAGPVHLLHPGVHRSDQYWLRCDQDERRSRHFSVHLWPWSRRLLPRLFHLRDPEQPHAGEDGGSEVDRAYHDLVGSNLCLYGVRARSHELYHSSLFAGGCGGRVLSGRDPLPDVLVPSGVPGSDHRCLHGCYSCFAGDRRTTLDGDPPNGWTWWPEGLAVAFHHRGGADGPLWSRVPDSDA